MPPDGNVIYHTEQRESSHSPQLGERGKFLTMSESEVFIRNLLKAIEEEGIADATLSVRAGLNRRAVTDLREGRVRSPKLSTVFALAEALNRDPGEMMGLGKRPQLQPDLVALLARYSPEDQERFLSALALLPGRPA